MGLGLDNLEIPGNSQIDDFLTEHGGLLHVLPLAVHHEILVSTQGPLVLGFWVWGFGALGLWA